MELAYVKIISGEYVLGKVEHQDENTIVLKKPISVIFDPMQGGLGFMPYDAMYLMKETPEIIFNKDQLIHVFEGDNIPVELKDKYVEFDTGIITEAPQGPMGPQPAPDMQAGLEQLQALAEAMKNQG
jgi:hypothetical protein